MSPAPRLGVVLSFARRRHLITFIAVGGLAVTWAAMLAFDWTAKLGTIALAPWVALIGFDLGVVGGVCAAAAALAAWIVATDVSNLPWDTAQISVRALALLALGVGSAFAGRV